MMIKVATFCLFGVLPWARGSGAARTPGTPALRQGVNKQGRYVPFSTHKPFSSGVV